ncbi:hypothetical protein BDQ12DRAFT_773016 [Crucibulum laeve]|uniref:Uncharacterized protein n=1 Tax=Crucibulum laeve TaxID=68775 RepID=A0A5C3LHF0_9AGAR|nr:hypothetical protein BDQ12DRAFT_773016 [Crucibulum laeve]
MPELRNYELARMQFLSAVAVKSFITSSSSLLIVVADDSSTAVSSLEGIEYRRRTRRLWWDDYASIVPAIFECFKIAITWFRLRHFDESEDSRHLKITLSFMNQTCFSFIIWWSRISLALAVVRITPVGSKARPWVIGLTCAFILNFIALVLGMTVTLWYIKLQPAQRRLVLLVFSTSVLTLVAVGAAAIVSYGKVVKGSGAKLVWLMTLNIEVSNANILFDFLPDFGMVLKEAISVIACNLPVLVFWGYRAFSNNDDDASGDHVTHHWSRVAPGGVSTPAFALSDLSSGHSKTSGESDSNVWKVTKDVPEAIS